MLMFFVKEIRDFATSQKKTKTFSVTPENLMDYCLYNTGYNNPIIYISKQFRNLRVPVIIESFSPFFVWYFCSIKRFKISI